MRTLGVDLAAKYSAGCVTDGSEVLHEFGSVDMSAFDLVRAIARAARDFEVDRCIVEDVPPHVKYGLKNIYRLQGLLMAPLATVGYLDKMLFVQPTPWQSYYPGVSRGAEEDRIKAARTAAEKIGYTPPTLVDDYIASVPEGKRPLVKHMKPLAKQETDFIDARLICHWAEQFPTLEAIEAKVKNQCQRPYI